jgi:hypothetical protein
VNDLEKADAGEGIEVYDEEQHAAQFASFGGDGANDEFMAKTEKVESRNEGDTDPATIEPVSRPPPGFSHPTTTMEMLDAVLHIVYSRLQPDEAVLTTNETWGSISAEDAAIWQNEMF